MEAVLHNADLVRHIARKSYTTFVCSIIMYYAGVDRDIHADLNDFRRFRYTKYYLKIKFAPGHTLTETGLAQTIRNILTAFETVNPATQNVRYATLLHGPQWNFTPEVRIELQNEPPLTLYYQFVNMLKDQLQTQYKYLRKTEVEHAYYICADDFIANQLAPIEQALNNETHRSRFDLVRPYAYIENTANEQ